MNLLGFGLFPLDWIRKSLIYLITHCDDGNNIRLHIWFADVIASEVLSRRYKVYFQIAMVSSEILYEMAQFAPMSLLYDINVP